MTKQDGGPAELSYSRLVRYASVQVCSDQLSWLQAEMALSDCPAGPDKIAAEQEMTKRRAACPCTACRARALLAAEAEEEG